MHLDFEIHWLAEQKIDAAWDCKRLDQVRAVVRRHGVRYQLEILTQGAL
jgi:hypothetical protein